MKLSIKMGLRTLKLICYPDHLFQKISRTMSIHLISTKLKNFQHKENVIVNGKKLIEINDVIVIKKKSLYKVVVPMSLRLTLLEKIHTQFGHPGIYKRINLITPQYYWPNIQGPTGLPGKETNAQCTFADEKYIPN